MEACHVLTWANYAAKTNAEFRGYKLNIIAKLEREGYEIVDCATAACFPASLFLNGRSVFSRIRLPVSP